MDEELGGVKCADGETFFPNYRNGHSQETVKTQLGEIDIKAPRDHKGNYVPKVIEKYDRNADVKEVKILSLYACGMSLLDIAEQIKSLYDTEISPKLVRTVIEKIMTEVIVWRNRTLEKVYAFVFMDVIHYEVKEGHPHVVKATYMVFGITIDGHKDILDMWICKNKSSKIWLNVLNGLKSRGVLCVSVLYRQPVRDDVSRPGGVSQELHAALYRPSILQLHQICQL